MKARFLLLACLSLLCGMFLYPGGSRAEEKTFIVGFDAEFPPYGYMDDTGEYVGFDLDLAAEVCRRNGWELVKRPIAWDSKDKELESGSISCIWNGFTMNGRENEYTWSVPYIDNSQVVIVKKGSSIAKLADLTGKILVVQSDSSALAALTGEDATEENKKLAESLEQLQQVGDYNSAFMNLESGTVDAIAMDIGVASYQLSAKNDEFQMLDERLASENYGIGFKKGNVELRDQVQETLFAMLDDGTFEKIAKQWELEKSICLAREGGAQAPGGTVADGTGANGAGTDGTGANGTGANGAGTDGTAANGAGANGTGANGAGTDGTAANGTGADGMANGTGTAVTDGTAAKGTAGDTSAVDEVTEKKNKVNKADIWTIIKQLSSGMLATLSIFFFTLLFAMPLGLCVSAVRRSRFKAAQWIARIYISIMRGTPLMLQLLVVFFAPYYVFGITVSYSYRFYAVLIGFSLNYAAYFAEIYRAGIQSIPIGQREAATVLGYSKRQIFFRIIFPQMVKRVLPPVTNEIITLVKDTSLAFALAYTEMFTMAKQIAAAQTSLLPLFVAGAFYFIFNFLVAFVMEKIEKKMDYYAS